MAVLQSLGISSVSSDFLNIMARIGAISGANSLSTFGLMLSGPAALFGLSFPSNFWIPAQVMSSSGADGYDPSIGHVVLNSSALVSHFFRESRLELVVQDISLVLRVRV